MCCPTKRIEFNAARGGGTNVEEATGIAQFRVTIPRRIACGVEHVRRDALSANNHIQSSGNAVVLRFREILDARISLRTVRSGTIAKFAAERDVAAVSECVAPTAAEFFYLTVTARCFTERAGQRERRVLLEDDIHHTSDGVGSILCRCTVA